MLPYPAGQSGALGHRPRKYRRGSALERLMAKAFVLPNGCWEYVGHVNAESYGCIMDANGKHSLAHRVCYEEHFGPIPEGMTLDHLCHKAEECPGGRQCPHRRCINPWHLEPVTREENLRRAAANHKTVPWMTAGWAANRAKTHCPHGHEYSPGNTYVKRNGGRVCRTCTRQAKAKTHTCSP